MGRSAPGARLPGGGPHFSREMGRKRAGALPLDPGFYGPLAAARSFWRLCHIVPVAGLLRYPCMCPDLETFFHKMLFQHIFPENASQIGVRISDEIAPPPDQRQRSQKRASGSKRAIKTGGPGGLPPALFLPISREKWGHPPGRRGPRGAAPQGRLPSHPPKGYLPPATDHLPHPPHKL